MFKGFFNRMYQGNPNKPDLDPDDMPKNKFELFFTTLGLRFGDLIKLNLLFVVMLLPIILWTWLHVTVLMNSLMGSGLTDELARMPTDAESAASSFGILSIYLLGMLVFLPLAGPPLAGLTYIARNYARDEHAWLWSDFKEQMKKNWKQSVAVMLILAVAIILSAVTLYLYSVMMESNSFMWVMRMLFIVFILLFFLSYMYVFPMLVTYKLKLGQILKNSLMLALGRLPFTLLFGVISIFPFIIALFVIFNFGYSPDSPVPMYTVLALVIYYLLLGCSLTSFILNSYTNATFDKLLRAEEDAPPDDGGREVKP
jgi:uncharacterized membrane protein YesL